MGRKYLTDGRIIAYEDQDEKIARFIHLLLTDSGSVERWVRGEGPSIDDFTHTWDKRILEYVRMHWEREGVRERENGVLSLHALKRYAESDALKKMDVISIEGRCATYRNVYAGVKACEYSALSDAITHAANERRLTEALKRYQKSPTPESMSRFITDLTRLGDVRARDTGKPVLRRLNTVRMQRVEWLWPKRIAIGKLSCVAGEGGYGKSQITCDIAARVTTGAEWPCGEGVAPLGDVLIITGEDGEADTVVPRLAAAGADVSRCVSLDIGGVDASGNRIERPFSLDDLGTLERALAEMPECKLIVIDPIGSFYGGADAHKESEVRAILTPLAKLAEKAGVAVLLVAHFNKSKGGRASTRVAGSAALRNQCRALYVVTGRKSEPTRYFLPDKNNLGPDSTGFTYSIDPVTLRDHDDTGERIDVDTSRIIWATTTTAQTADELLAELDGAADTTKTEHVKRATLQREGCRRGGRCYA